MIRSNPNPAWPLRSDAENAGSALPPACHIQPTRRERAFDAAQRLVLSQPHMAIGQLEQNRLATYILELADRFEAWMSAPEADAQPAELAEEVAAVEAADPVIDAYIESDNRVMAMMAKLKPIDIDAAMRGMAEISGRVDEIIAAANSANRRML